MDFELEMGFYVSQPVPFGSTLESTAEARKHIFGFVMLNDWSARDIQFTEMMPLGPFNGKGSGTTVSPWVVTLDAFEGAEVERSDELAGINMAKVAPHLKEAGPATWNIEVSVQLRRNGFQAPVQIVKSNLRDLYWSPSQMLAHHASAGCGLRTGDLCGTGTISRPPTRIKGLSSSGCLHKITEGGNRAFEMRNGDVICWLEDEDEIVLTGRVVRSDGSWSGFGECKGVLKAAVE